MTTGGADMILNIILVFILGAVIGGIAHYVMGGAGSLFHNAFIGIVGITVADTLSRIVGIYPGIIVKLILDVIGACIFIFAINRIKNTARKR